MEGKKALRVIRNVLTAVLWVIVLAAVSLPARYINSMYGYLAFFLLMLCLIFSLLVLGVLKRKVSVDTGLSGTSVVRCARGERVPLGLKVVNSSRLCCPHARAVFHISDLFGGDDSVDDSDFTLAPRSESSFDFDMDMRHIGVYRVGLKRLTVFDMSGFFKRDLPVEGDFEVHVGPRIYTMDELSAEQEIFLESMRDTRNTVKNGTDYVGVREYELGDSMKSIHWKLSAHSTSYMTKLSESTRQSDYAVVLDFAAGKADREELMDIYDTLVETAFSVLEELSHREVTYSLIYCDRQHEVRRSTPRGRADDMEYIRRFDVITPEPDSSYPDGRSLLEQEGRMPNRSTNIVLCTSRITKELVQQIMLIRRQKRFPELYLIVPERLTGREREELTAPLRSLDDMDIPWHARLTGINIRQGMPAAGKEAEG